MKKALILSSLLNAVFVIWLSIKFNSRLLPRFNTPEKKTTIVMYGDSRVRSGDWEAGLQRNDVHNAAISGTTTANLLDSLNRVIVARPKVCILQCGINDVRCRVTTDITIRNYIRIIDELQYNKIMVVVSSIIPVSKDPFQYEVPDAEINKKVDTLNTMIKALAAAKGIEYMDINKEMAENKRIKLRYTLDGIHINSDGFAVWYNEVKAVLNKYHL